jgi:hypothetical protein
VLSRLDRGIIFAGQVESDCNVQQMERQVRIARIQPNLEGASSPPAANVTMLERWPRRRNHTTPCAAQCELVHTPRKNFWKKELSSSERTTTGLPRFA